LKALLR